jgi:large subunit ribosomal protein L30
MSLSDIVSKVAESFTEKGQKKSGATGAGDDGGKIRIQYYRSHIAFPKTQKQIVRSIGLTKLNQIVARPDTPAMRGVVAKVPHLLRIVE